MEDVYAFEAHLKAKHPLNNNVQAKTRSGQQLQFLMDKNVIEFLGRGQYRVMGGMDRRGDPSGLNRIIVWLKPITTRDAGWHCRVAPTYDDDL